MSPTGDTAEPCIQLITQASRRARNKREPNRQHCRQSRAASLSFHQQRLRAFDESWWPHTGAFAFGAEVFVHDCDEMFQAFDDMGAFRTLRFGMMEL
jgi:hypothetical protein